MMPAHPLPPHPPAPRKAPGHAETAYLLNEIRCALLDQATDKKLTALVHRRRCMKLRNKIAAFYGQK